MLEDGQNLKNLTDAHNQASAQFKATSKAMKMLQSVTTHMDGLRKLGDTVSPEDVIAAAGKIVGAGAPAVQMAGMLAAMPTEPGEALAGWVQQQEAQMQAKAQALQQAHEAARHSMATGALREIVGHTVDQHMQDFQSAAAGAGGAPGGGEAPSPAAGGGSALGAGGMA